MTNKEYADLLLPGVEHTWEEYEKMYPERDLEEGAMVTRYAPSPTGFVHIGALLVSFLDGRFAAQTNGVNYLRIEDTDQERSIENGISSIINSLDSFGITFDEGQMSETESKGNYGPYIQTERGDIYKAYAKKLIEEDKAYASFLSKEELDKIREEQSKSKQRLGIYGRYAKDRNLSKEETIDYFDTDWNLLEMKQNFPNSAVHLDKPNLLEEMLKLSGYLSKNRPFLRVDWYIVNGQLKFSEFTYYSDAGVKKFHPNEWDYVLGDWIELPQ